MLPFLYEYITYTKDGSGYVTSGPYKKPGSNEKYVDTLSNFNYRISGKDIIISEGGEVVETDNITQLNSSGLETLFTYNGAAPDSDMGFDMNTIFKVIMDTHFVKQ